MADVHLHFKPLFALQPVKKVDSASCRFFNRGTAVSKHISINIKGLENTATDYHPWHSGCKSMNGDSRARLFRSLPIPPKLSGRRPSFSRGFRIVQHRRSSN